MRGFSRQGTGKKLSRFYWMYAALRSSLPVTYLVAMIGLLAEALVPFGVSDAASPPTLTYLGAHFQNDNESLEPTPT